MSFITQGDFNQWREDKVTEAFFLAARERIEDAKQYLSTSAGVDSLQDRFLVGLVHAYTEMQDFRVEDE